MHCIATLGAYPNESAKDYIDADILVLDGCPVCCGKIILQKVGIEPFKSVLLTDLGYQKGKTPVTQDILNEIYLKIETL